MGLEGTDPSMLAVGDEPNVIVVGALKMSDFNTHLVWNQLLSSCYG